MNIMQCCWYKETSYDNKNYYINSLPAENNRCYDEGYSERISHIFLPQSHGRRHILSQSDIPRYSVEYYVWHLFL